VHGAIVVKYSPFLAAGEAPKKKTPAIAGAA